MAIKNFDKPRVRNYVILAFNTLAVLLYCGFSFSLVPENRLAFLEQQGSFDYFPNRFSFLVNGIFVLILGGAWLTAGILAMKGTKVKITKKGDPSVINARLIFEYPTIRHAFVFAFGMLFSCASMELMTHANDVSPWVGFAIQAIATAFYIYTIYRSSPKSLLPEVMGYTEKLMIQALVTWVANYEFGIFLFWLLNVANLYTPPDLSMVENSESPSPTPTEFHQKAVTQAIGIAFTFITTGVTIISESGIRTYVGCLPTVIMLAGIALNYNQAYWYAVGCLIALCVAQIIIVIVNLFVCEPAVKLMAKK